MSHRYEENLLAILERIAVALENIAYLSKPSKLDPHACHIFTGCLEVEGGWLWGNTVILPGGKKTETTGFTKKFQDTAHLLALRSGLDTIKLMAVTSETPVYIYIPFQSLVELFEGKPDVVIEEEGLEELFNLVKMQIGNNDVISHRRTEETPQIQNLISKLEKIRDSVEKEEKECLMSQD